LKIENFYVTLFCFVNIKQDRQDMYNIQLKCVHPTTVAVEEQ